MPICALLSEQGTQTLAGSQGTLSAMLLDGIHGKSEKRSNPLKNVVLVAGCLHVQLAQFFGGSRTFLQESEGAKPNFKTCSEVPA
jgi:hypothetical protein